MGAMRRWGDSPDQRRRSAAGHCHNLDSIAEGGAMRSRPAGLRQIDLSTRVSEKINTNECARPTPQLGSATRQRKIADSLLQLSGMH